MCKIFKKDLNFKCFFVIIIEDGDFMETITNPNQYESQTFYDKLNTLIKSMNLNIDLDKFMGEVSSEVKTFEDNPLKKGMIEGLVSAFYGEDNGRYITERQTIEKLSIILGEQVVYNAIFNNDYSELRKKLADYDINYDIIIEKLKKLENENNKEENLAAQIELELLYGFEQKLLEEKSIDVFGYEDNLYTKESSPYKENSVGYENLDKTRNEFKNIYIAYKKKMIARGNNNGHNKN